MTTITNNNKNCEIYMYNKNTGLLNSELKLMNELKNIFKNKNDTIYGSIYNGYKDDRVVIKTPKKKDGSVDSLKYEYTMGCQIRKHLCDRIPNFMKVLGYIKKEKQEYLIVERIIPANTLRELIKEKPDINYCSIKSKQLLSIVLQILCSVQMAQNVLDFVHYDLHFGNIVITQDKNAPENLVYKYNDRNKKPHSVTVPVIDKNIAVIIDYGRVHTLKSEKFFFQNPECFQPYKFLTDKKRMSNIVDIRKFDSIYDIKRFCRILETYLNRPKEFSGNIYNDIREPHDLIKRIIKKFQKYFN